MLFSIFVQSDVCVKRTLRTCQSHFRWKMMIGWVNQWTTKKNERIKKHTCVISKIRQNVSGQQLRIDAFRLKCPRTKNQTNKRTNRQTEKRNEEKKQCHIHGSSCRSMIELEFWTQFKILADAQPKLTPALTCTRVRSHYNCLIYTGKQQIKTEKLTRMRQKLNQIWVHLTYPLNIKTTHECVCLCVHSESHSAARL